MPRTSQIIPEYLTPHVKTYINDNSTFLETTATQSDDGVRLLCVFTSAKGEDGVVKPITSISDYLEEYGTPNYNLYGQPCYMPYAALSSGNAKCYCMRVMPETAPYANTVISAYVKVDTDAEGNKIFKVKFGANSITDLVDKGSVLLQMQDMAVLAPEVNDDGYNVYPLFAVNAKGRGAYGNGFHIRVVSDKLMNADNNYMNYIYEVLDSSTGTIVKKEQHRGGFDVGAIVDNISLLIDDIISDPDNGSDKIDIVTYTESFDAIYAAYSDFVTTNLTGTTIPNMNACDLLTGLTKAGTALPSYVIDTNAADAVALDSTLGVALTGGHDSTFAANYTPTIIGGVSTPTRQECIDEAYIKAFKGEYDHDVVSKRCAPCELILDANYSENVKLALAECILNRYDARGVLDAGILTTTSAAIAWTNKPTIKAISDFVISKECQHYKIRDPFTGRAIPVTATYFIAENLPTHYKSFGNQVPFVGEGYAQLSGHIRNSLKPSIDADNLEVKEVLYNNRCNFFECIAEDNYVRGVQGTSQNVWSDLSEENNVAVLLEMKRMLEEFVGARLYNFAEAEDRVRFTEDATRMFADFRGSKVRSYEVYFDMNAFEETRSILHCYLAVVFRTIAKRGIIEIDINKRV